MDSRRPQDARSARGEGWPDHPAPDAGADPAAVTETRRERRTIIALASLFTIVATLTGFDLAMDLRHGIELEHAIAEGGVMLAGLAGATWMLLRLRALADQALELGRHARTLEADLLVSLEELDASKADAEHWRIEVGELVAGLGAAIDRQLARWQLSPAEQEVALLLLKGLSHKEIADLRGTGEATVRQQSTAIYRKAGLDGRHDLAAFFLEDLLGPRDVAPGGSGRDR